MTNLFLEVLNMSVRASCLILAVVLVRLLLRKPPAWCMRLLWAMTAVRLLCPFALRSHLSLLPTAEPVEAGLMWESLPTADTGIAAAANPAASIITPGVNPLQIWLPVITMVWLAVAVMLVVYAAVSSFRLHRRLRTAVRLCGNIYQSEHADTPFVFGVTHPKIFIPFHLSEEDMPYVTAHEAAHIRHKDHWWKPVGYLITAVHWFNPLVWLAYFLFCQDIELACDERVVRSWEPSRRAAYAQALLNCSVSRRTMAACPLAFGETGVQSRVKAVLGYRKKALWTVVLAVFLCILLSACFLTDPPETIGGENAPVDGYYLWIQAEGVVSIEVSTPGQGGGCCNADGSPFKVGEKVYLEQLEGITDLRGVSVTALNADEEILYALSVPEGISDGELVNVIASDGWLLTPIVISNLAGKEAQPNDSGSSGAIGFSELVPGESVSSANAVAVPEGSSVYYSITWARSGLTLEYGLRAPDGTEYSREAEGGNDNGVLNDIPAGTYFLFVRNSGNYEGLPAYEDPSHDLSFNATGAFNIRAE